MNVEKNSWIPSFVQGLITTNFQNYSGMNVVDRQNVDDENAKKKLLNINFIELDAQVSRHGADSERTERGYKD